MDLSGLAPAKINLFLHVAGPGADGFHALSSLMVFADIGDQVTVTPADSLGLKVYGPFAHGLDGEGDNLVLRAARGLMAQARRPLAPLGLALNKALPVAAGLGGGSSDAGTTLRLLREAWNLSLSDSELEAVAAALGSDGAACLWGRPVLAEGRGERLSPAPVLPVLDAVLVNPGVSVSTGQVYGLYDRGGRFSDPAPPPMPGEIESIQELAAWLADGLYGAQARQSKADPALVHAAVKDKDWFWNNDYNILNGVHTHGQRYNPFGPQNYPDEVRKLREMAALRDGLIHAVATGQTSSLKVDDSKTHPLPPVPTNYQPSNKNGPMEYLYGKDAEKS